MVNDQEKSEYMTRMLASVDARRTEKSTNASNTKNIKSHLAGVEAMMENVRTVEGDQLWLINRLMKLSKTARIELLDGNLIGARNGNGGLSELDIMSLLDEDQVKEAIGFHHVSQDYYFSLVKQWAIFADNREGRESPKEMSARDKILAEMSALVSEVGFDSDTLSELQAALAALEQ